LTAELLLFKEMVECSAVGEIVSAGSFHPQSVKSSNKGNKTPKGYFQTLWI